ncbi:hypothetical protein FBU30_007045 [Linnemannia zychae]|nr:hypothetical protein FBU30_007045 [Linnemannia zychae]
MIPTFNNSTRSVVNDNALKRDSTFKVKYFKVHAMGGYARAILAASGAKWENEYPNDWANEDKKLTMFGVLPNLFETTASGQVIEIPESEAIENYLSRKFNLLGDDIFDEIKIRAFCSNITSMSTFMLTKIGATKDPEAKATYRTQFIESLVPRFVKYHEHHLEANGRNGHYVGNKLSFADVKLAVLLVYIFSVTGETQINKEATPAIWAVWEKVNAIPSYEKWIKSEEYKTICETNMQILSY